MRKMILLVIVLILAAGFLAASPVFAQSAENSRDFSGDTIYFILVDRFSDGDPANNPKPPIFSPDKSEWKLYWGGDLQGIIDHLPYIRKMGYTAIWLTPVFDNTEALYLYGKDKEEKISAYHGYWGRDFFEMNRYFGSKDKFRELVQKAHENDIKIIFDYVLNHTSPHGQGIDGALYKDGKFIADYSHDPEGWFHHSGSIDFRINTPAEWQNKNLFDLSDLNSEKPEVEKYLFDAAREWLGTGIDAFRLDTVRHVPESFCTRFHNEMKKANPNVFVFGEWSMGGLDVPGAVEFTKTTGISLIDFRFTFYVTDVLCRGLSFKKLADYIALDNTIENPNLMVTCIDNHDMPRFISTALDNGATEEMARKKTETATYIMMTTRGIPCIYYGTEEFFHVDKRSTWGYGGEPYNRQMMTGFDNWNEFRSNVRMLAKLRKELPALSKGTQKTVRVTDNIWVYERKYGDSVVVTAVNKGRKQTIEVEGLTLPDGTYDDISTTTSRVMGPCITVTGGKTRFALGNHQVGIWFNRK